MYQSFLALCIVVGIAVIFWAGIIISNNRQREKEMEKMKKYINRDKSNDGR